MITVSSSALLAFLLLVGDITMTAATAPRCCSSSSSSSSCCAAFVVGRGRAARYYSTEQQSPERIALSSSILSRSSRMVLSMSKADSVGVDTTDHTSATRTPTTTPVILLAGFLGSGKTSALQHLLHDPRHQRRLGIIVNDMAQVNVDAKVVRQSTAPDPSSSSPVGGAAAAAVVQMQNGCACCSLADELHVSVQQLLQLDGDQDPSSTSSSSSLDAIVVELSGVADPSAIRNTWSVAAPVDIRTRAPIQNVVTMVDATTFGTDYLSWDQVKDRSSSGASSSWSSEVDGADEASAMRKVSELLAEQVEAANVVLLNKADLASAEQLEVAKAVVSALNDKARIEIVTHGKIDPTVLLGIGGASNDEMADETLDLQADACADPQCTDPSHEHSHEHHEHDHGHSHDHSHDDAASSCADPNCNDPSHEHSHTHSHTSSSSTGDTSLESLGITSFVYRATKPFEGRRLMNLLGNWPVPVKTVLDKELLLRGSTNSQGNDNDYHELYELGDPTTSPFVGLLRSKGFCWLAPSRWNPRQRNDGRYEPDDAWRHDTAMYWSHAGKHFSISAAGRWWATLDKEQMQQYLADNVDEYNKILNEDFVTDEFGDRRQEIVFIGTNMNQDKITSALDACLLNDAQMNIYRQKLQNYQQQILSVDPVGATSSSSGLFGVGSSGHLDVDP